jgi:hypothetical protein
MTLTDEREKAYRDRIEELECEVKQLRKLLIPPFVVPVEWSMTATEADVVRLLVSRTYMTVAMVATLFEMDKAVLATLLVHVRKKLAPLEVVVKNDRDRGWYLEKWDKEKILQHSTDWIEKHEVSDLERAVELSDALRKMADSATIRKIENLFDVIRHVRKTI